MTDPIHIPDHVGREAVRLLNIDCIGCLQWFWPDHRNYPAIITVAKLLMKPHKRMTDPDEDAARRVIEAAYSRHKIPGPNLKLATEQMRKEREAWEESK